MEKKEIDVVIIYSDADIEGPNHRAEKLFCRLDIARQKESLRIFCLSLCSSSEATLRHLSGCCRTPWTASAT